MFRFVKMKIPGLVGLARPKQAGVPNTGIGQRYNSDLANSKLPTGRAARKPNYPTKGRIWERLSEVEGKFAGLLKDVYEREVLSRTDIASLKGGLQLVGWKFGVGVCAFTIACGLVVYVVNKLDRHYPGAVVAVVNKNFVQATPLDPKDSVPAAKGPT
ncbi:hypothetical protein B9Z19DRAFT_1076041 [Tuber borchii]|uniref:Uncharacterized protein n=1 Tax=Tuber borchii TaxID=42251 RepID=A0A2T7A2G6_TUBBO|nr:hypothetical protein B9Z19DRAFT_1076041 [Tuber borchii]